MKPRIVGFFDTVKIARLANLTLSKKEISRLTIQLTSILNYIEKLNEVDTSNVRETSQVTGLENVTREDVIDSSRTLTQEEALSNVKSKYNGFFKVKGILNGE